MWLQSHAKKIASVIFFWISGCRKKKENTSNTAIIWGVKKLKWTYTILTSKPGMNKILDVEKEEKIHLHCHHSGCKKIEK
jgi:hypothetical protein